MSDYLEGKAVRKVVRGVQVSRSMGIDGATVDLFNIVGGRVIVSQISGIVTTELGASGNCRLIMNPTVATASNLCADNDLGTDDVGTMYGITGTVGDPLQDDDAVLVAQADPLILPAGVIEFLSTSDVDGEILWEVIYTPIDDGAYIESA